MNETLLVAIFLDLNSAIYFISNFPQLVTTYTHRKNLIALSFKTMLGQDIAGWFFIFAGILTGAWLAVALSFVGQSIGLYQLYLKVKYRKVT